MAGVGGTVVAAGFYQGPATALALGEEFHHNRVTVVSSQIGSLPATLRERWSRERLHAGGDHALRRRTDRTPARWSAMCCRPREAAEAYALIDRAAAGSAAGDLGLQGRRRIDGGGERMRHAVRLSVQEQYLRGATMIEKWEHAQRLGFDAIELRGRGEGQFAARLPELSAAAAAGVPMPTVCVEMLHFVGDFDADRRARRPGPDEVPAERHGRQIGGRLAMTPASYGMFSRRLPAVRVPAHRGGGHRDPAGRLRRSSPRTPRPRAW